MVFFAYGYYFTVPNSKLLIGLAIALLPVGLVIIAYDFGKSGRRIPRGGKSETQSYQHDEDGTRLEIGQVT